MTEIRVLGESVLDLAEVLHTMHWQPGGSGMTSVTGTVSINGPLVRALFRAEAELLLDDVAAMAAGCWKYRTQEERSVDAFVLLAQRITAAGEADDPSELT